MNAVVDLGSRGDILMQTGFWGRETHGGSGQSG